MIVVGIAHPTRVLEKGDRTMVPLLVCRNGCIRTVDGDEEKQVTFPFRTEESGGTRASTGAGTRCRRGCGYCRYSRTPLRPNEHGVAL